MDKKKEIDRRLDWLSEHMAACARTDEALYLKLLAEFEELWEEFKKLK